MLPEMSACKELEKHRKSIRKIKKVLKLMAVSQNHEGMLINNAMYYLNLIFLYDLIVYSFSIGIIRRERTVEYG